MKRVAGEYEKQTGNRPHMFSGSSMGAVKFGHIRVDLRNDI